VKDTIQITVTKEDIAKGYRKRSTCCPIALAARRFFGDKYMAYVQQRWIQVTERARLKDGDYYWVFDGKLTKKAKKFINDFDSGKPVKPTFFQFENKL
jgi:hypothetical protein